MGVKLPDICLIGEEKPRKILTQETCPDRGSNPGPLRDRRACYRLLHSGGLPDLNIIKLVVEKSFTFVNTLWNGTLIDKFKWAMDGISVILVKNHFLILLQEFIIHNQIYYFLKFQISITDVESFIKPLVNFYAI